MIVSRLVVSQVQIYLFTGNKVDPDELEPEFIATSSTTITTSTTTIYVFQLLHHMMDGVQHMMDRGTSYYG